MKQSITEKTLTPAELKKREEIVKQLKSEKSSLVKRYGKDAEKVMYGRATNIAKKTAENMNKDKVREMIKKTLMSPAGEASEKGWNSSKDTEEIKNLMKVADNTSNSYDERDKARQKAYDLRAKLKTNEAKKSFPDLTGDGKITKADILKGRGVNIVTKEDIDLGHQDDEPDMLKASVYRIAQYAVSLYKMLDKYDQMDQEVDFPDWWQEKIHLASDYMDKAKHYLEFEEKQPALDAMIQEEKSKFFSSKANINPELVQKIEDFIREVAQDYDYGVDDAYFAIMQVLKAGLVKEEVNEEEAEAKDAVDTVTMDVPLFIRMLEFAREDAKADVDLHDVTEKAVALNKEKETLSMQDYENIIPAMEEPMEEGLPKGFWKKETANLDETFEKLVGKLKKQGKSEKAAKAIAGAVAQYKAKGGGKGPTTKQAARLK